MGLFLLWLLVWVMCCGVSWLLFVFVWGVGYLVLGWAFELMFGFLGGLSDGLVVLLGIVVVFGW